MGGWLAVAVEPNALTSRMVAMMVAETH